MNNSKSGKEILKSLGIIVLIIAIYKIALEFVEFVAAPIYRNIGWLKEGEEMRVTSEFTVSNVIAYAVGIVIALAGYIIIIKVKKHKLFEYTSLNKFSPKCAAICAFFGFCVNVTVMYVMILGKSNEALGNIYNEYLKSAHSGSVWIMLLFVGFMIPVFEEMIYRGLIFNQLRESMGQTPAILLQAFLFVAFEMIVGGAEFSIVETAYGFTMAVIFALFYVWSGSLWSSIFARAFKNLAALIIVAFFSESTFISARYIIMTITIIGIFASFIVMMKIGKKSANNTKN